jgi:endosialidase-like protein
MSMKKLLLGSRFSLLRLASLFTTVAAIFFASVPLTYAVVPAPDGGYASANTAEGTNALFSLTTGAWNTAVGFEALRANTTGATNTAIGLRALRDNLDGDANTAVGSQALNNTTGSHNIAVGAQAGLNITTGSDNIDVGSSGTAMDGKTIRIGRAGVQDHTFIAGISGVPLAGGAPVVIRTDGQLGVASVSSARFKEQIKPIDKASEAIFALRPVTFLYKKDIDPQGMPQFGLVAEEVAKVNPDLVTRDDKGALYTVRYDAVNAMLLNEFLKEHGKVEQLAATAEQQAKEIKALSATVKEQAAQIQKVNARLELDKPAPRTVLNNQ